MSKVTAGFSISLDGYVADRNDGVEDVFRWYSTPDAKPEYTVGELSTEGAEYIREAGNVAGVLVTGRRTFDLANAWNGRHPMNVPIVVVTHQIPEEWEHRSDTPFTFVTTGVPEAIQVAQQIAAAKTVVVGAPSITKQCLRLGLLDEIHLDLVPVVLGGGIRLFEEGLAPLHFKVTAVSGSPTVTHLTYQVVR
jgi:dihydrofolate reductase